MQTGHFLLHLQQTSKRFKRAIPRRWGESLRGVKAPTGRESGLSKERERERDEARRLFKRQIPLFLVLEIHTSFSGKSRNSKSPHSFTRFVRIQSLFETPFAKKSQSSSFHLIGVFVCFFFVLVLIFLFFSRSRDGSLSLYPKSILDRKRTSPHILPRERRIESNPDQSQKAWRSLEVPQRRTEFTRIPGSLFPETG